MKTKKDNSRQLRNLFLMLFIAVEQLSHSFSRLHYTVDTEKCAACNF